MSTLAVTTTPHRPASRGNSLILLFMASIPSLPVAYVLSLGPALRLMDQGLVGEDSVNTLYFPLIVLADRSPAITTALEWYIDLWTNDL